MQTDDSRTLRSASRAAGIGRRAHPTLRVVRRRRFELLALTSFVGVGCATLMVILGLDPSPVESIGGSITLVRAGLIALAVAFAVYVVEKERSLHRLHGILLNERVFGAALANRLEEISMVARAGRAVMSGQDLRGTLAAVLQGASDLLEADEGSIMLLRDQNLVLAAGTGRAAAFVDHHQPIEDGLAGYVLRTRQSLAVAGEIEMDELQHMLGCTTRPARPIRSALSVPLLAGDRPLGVLSLNIIDGDRRYREYDLWTLELFAQQAAFAIHRAEILDLERDDLRARLGEMDSAQSRSLEKITSVRRPDATSTARQRSDVLRGLRVLVVEDDPALLGMLEDALVLSGCRVLLASDGQTAIDRIRTEEPDIVLLDIALPVLDGWGVLEHLGARDGHTRIICLTGRSSSRDRTRAWKLGVAEYVAKPFDLDRLIGVVEDVAGRSEEDEVGHRDEALRKLFAV